MAARAITDETLLVEAAPVKASGSLEAVASLSVEGVAGAEEAAAGADEAAAGADEAAAGAEAAADGAADGAAEGAEESSRDGDPGGGVMVIPNCLQVSMDSFKTFFWSSTEGQAVLTPSATPVGKFLSLQAHLKSVLQPETLNWLMKGA